jgi:methylenetetrahydrofolate/methylenetetrahydromethanopterin dehydrogenase (NADP+)
VRKILVQLDTDEHPSTFDAIVGYDGGADVILSYGGITPEVVRGLVQDTVLARSVQHLSTLAICLGGSEAAIGERVLEEVLASFSGPSRVSVMLDSDGCNTTVAAGIAILAQRHSLKGERAVVIGLGPLGLRAARLLHDEGCQVLASSIPGDLLLGQTYRRPRGLDVARRYDFAVVEPANCRQLEVRLAGATIVVCAAPAGVQVLRERFWLEHPTLRTALDFNAAEPFGIERRAGAQPHDSAVLVDAFAIGRHKMRLHRRCVASLFESNDLVLDIASIFAIARELIQANDRSGLAHGDAPD